MTGKGDSGSGGVDGRATELRRTATPPGPGESWTVLRMVLWSAGYLEEKGVERPRLEAEHLLADALETGRMQLYLQFDRPLTAEELVRYRSRLLRRARREPLQYIRGRTAFRELDLLTDSRVLIPRPETEELVGCVLDWAKGKRELRGVDVGTGSGAIALSLALEGPFTRMVAIDLSSEALEVAKANLERTGPRSDGAPPSAVEFRLGNLLAPLADDEVYDVVVSNPPYVADGEWESLSPEVREWEPGSALRAGPTGLEVIAALLADAPRHLADGGLLALEVGMGQSEAVLEALSEGGGFRKAWTRKDLAGRDRFVLAER